MRILVIIIATMSLLACKQNSQKYFQVGGTVKNNPAQMIFLEATPLATMQRIVLDSAKIGKDGKFSLKAKTKEEGLFNLRLAGETYPFISLVNDANDIKVNVDFNDMKEFYTVQGSPASQEIKEYLNNSGEKFRSIYFLEVQIDSLSKNKSPDSIINLSAARVDEEMKAVKQYTTGYIHSAKNASVAMFILGSFQASSNQLRMEGYKTDEVGDLITELSIKFPGNNGIAVIKKSLQEQQQKPTGLTGRAAPEISLSDPSGKNVKLSSFKGKYVLVDFWASWCKPCRLENPNVVKAYTRFKDKNFTVLGVSLDQQKDPWIAAIKNDGLTWTHVSDLKYWNSEVVPLYNIEGIPFNVLVDPAGNIVAENLRGHELDAKLEEVLK